MTDIVFVSEYNPDWIEEFEQEKVKIISSIKDICCSIEHIGSTSVLGLGAKPIIDIMAGVNDLGSIEQRHIDLLENIGYEYVPKPDSERIFFRRGKWRAGTHHIHIYVYKDEHWNKNILFRDYLKNHPEELIEYYKLKKQLEEKYMNNRAQYTNAKAPFIESVIQKALKEIGK